MTNLNIIFNFINNKRKIKNGKNMNFFFVVHQKDEQNPQRKKYEKSRYILYISTCIFLTNQ